MVSSSGTSSWLTLRAYSEIIETNKRAFLFRDVA